MKLVICALVILGTAFGAPSPRIIGGEDASAGEFPYQISYQWGFLEAWHHICGGIILTPTWILTAGHCVIEIPSFGDFQIIAGILNLNDTDNQVIKVIDKIVHPDYLGGVGPNDLALLKLETALEWNDNVQPINLPTTQDDPTGTAALSGWGTIGGSSIFPIKPNTLQKVELPLLTSQECRDALNAIIPESGNSLDDKSNVCTGSSTAGLSACSGDSGGPLAQGNTVIGIVSWVITPCGTEGAPSVYTRVSTFNDWILENIDDSHRK